MTHRTLLPHEYHRLAGTSLGDTWQRHGLPDGLQIVVVEDTAGQIVGHMAVFVSVHAEDWWIREDHWKRGAVLKHLLEAGRDIMDTLGTTHYIVHAADDHVSGVLTKLGAARLPGDPYSVPVRKE